MAYIPKTKFELKDDLAKDDANKIIYGREFAVEFEAISGAVNEIERNLDQLKDDIEDGSDGGSGGGSYDDTQIKADLSTETQQRISADTALGLRIDAVEGGIGDGGGFVDAPNDGKLYGRQSQNWAEVVIPDAGVSDWADIENKPTEFPPADHNQPWSTITDTPDDYPPEDHTHEIADIDGLQDALDNAGTSYAVAIADTPPENGKSGDTWFDSTEGEGALYIHDGDVWFSSNTFSKESSGGGGGSVEAVASGALATGEAVIVNADGTVSVVGGNEIVGGVTDFELSSAATNVTGHDVCMDLKNNRVVYAYYTSSSGSLHVGEIKGDSIEWGTGVIFCSERVFGLSLSYNAVTKKVVIVFTKNISSSNKLPHALICTVNPSANEASVSTAVMLINKENCQYFSHKPIVEPSTGYMAWLFAFQDKKIQSCTINSSGNDPVVESTTTHVSDADVSSNNKHIPTILDPVSNRFLALYKKTDATTGTQVLVGSLSPSGQVSMTVGGVISIFKYDDGRISDSGGYKKALEYHPPSKSFISVTHQYGWRNAAEINVKTLTIVQIKISPQTGVVEIGEPLIFEGVDDIDHSSLCYYPPAKKLSLHLESKKPSLITQYATIDVVDDVVAISGFNDFVGGWNVNQAYDPVTMRNVLSAYNTNDGKVYDALQTYDAFDGNLTDTNYIGTSSADYADGETATIQTVGSVSEDQSGLTAGLAYYVQPDGSLGTSGNVFAGTAISSAKLIVKG